jgi:hypothetical protein
VHSHTHRWNEVLDPGLLLMGAVGTVEQGHVAALVLIAFEARLLVGERDQLFEPKVPKRGRAEVFLTAGGGGGAKTAGTANGAAAPRPIKHLPAPTAK